MIEVEPYRRSDETLAYLPPAWVGDTFWSLAAALMVGFRVNCPEQPETVQENIREIAPHFLVAPPRISENLVSQVQVKMDDASFVKRTLYNLFMPIGYDVARCRMKNVRSQSGSVCCMSWESFLFSRRCAITWGFAACARPIQAGRPWDPRYFCFSVPWALT